MKLKNSDFIHLHLHSHYSLLDGLTKIPELLDRALEYGIKSLALTDHGTLSGVIEFYKEAQKRDIKPIIGMEAYLSAASHLRKESASDRRSTHLILLAKNNQGYRNLIKLASIAYLDGFYYRPRIDKQLLKKYNQGLIVLSGCMGGEISEAINSNNLDKAQEIALWYKKVFGNRFYLELQDHAHNQPSQKRLNDQLLKLSEKLKIEPVVTADSHYLDKTDAQAHEVLLCIQTKNLMDDQNRMSLKGWQLDFSHPQTVIKRWQKLCPQAILNTKKIADQCQVEIRFDQVLLPTFKVPRQKDNSVYLKQLVFTGLADRYLNLKLADCQELSVTQIRQKLTKEVIERADYELSVIKKMNFASYFLIVWDFCRWGKENNIFFGPGRGSAAGSIVSYSLRITDIDPLKYNLLFERFLNTYRISMPDIDIDIQDNRRDEVIQYVTQKYGQDRVASIVTMGTMAARNAVRDVARVLNVPYLQADRLAKMLPPPVFGRNVSLKDSLQKDQALKAKYNQDDQARQVIDLAMQLEGTIRSHGVHAAGIVIAPTALTDYLPLEVTSKGVVTSQYSMFPIEDLGLLKMDFLGLSNLTIIKNALRIIRKVYNKTIDLEDLDLADAKTYKLLSSADTTGVFQLESKGMRQYLQRLKPANFEDIAAILALYRPGPISAGLVDQFVERRHGRQKVTVKHPAFAKVLASTYGVLVYQEQVMRISRDVCGFDGMEADELRKAIGKKQRDRMRKMKQKFIEGGVKKGKIPRNIIEDFWEDIVGFADYAFNRSHSVSYGMITYQTAYLKAHFRAALMAAMMTSDSGNTDRLKIAVAECNQVGLKVLPPDINQSFPEFAVIKKDKNQSVIRFGLEAIKGVSSQAVQRLVEIRNQAGPYNDLADFVIRQKDNPTLNRKTLENLIKSGVFESLTSREQALANLDNLVNLLSWVNKKEASQQASLWDDSQEAKADLSALHLDSRAQQEFDLTTKLDWEKELLGIYVSQHPLDAYQQPLDDYQLTPLSELEVEIENIVQGTRYQIAGLISNFKAVVAKVSRRKMAVIDLEDRSGSIELVVFPALFEEYKDCWAEGSILVLDVVANIADYKGGTLSKPSWMIKKVVKIAIKAKQSVAG